ncbi:MAG: Hpt domain-containing protein [Burkholderiales bacterium]
MNAIPVTRPGPLTWVKPEIDFALERAHGSLEQYFGAPGQMGPALLAALGSVREVTGALQIIGIEGLGRFSREVEELLEALTQRSVAPEPSLKELLTRATTTLAQHLAGLMSGEQDSAMRLVPLMRELARERGMEVVDERDLFYPDLDNCPPPHPAGEALDGQALASLVKLQRSRFQRGMLNWLRQSEDGLEIMRDALQEIERAQPHPDIRAQWWVAAAFVEGLLYGGMPTTDEIKRLAGKVDRHLAGFAPGVRASEGLMREMLFHLARCEPVSPLVRDVKSLYRLDQHVVPSAVVGLLLDDPRNAEPLLPEAQNVLLSARTDVATQQADDRRLVNQVAHEMLANLQQVEQALDPYFRGQAGAESLADLAGVMRNVAGALNMLGMESAAQLIVRSTSMVEELSRTDGQGSGDDITLLAEGLSSVMLFIQALDHGNCEELEAVESILARFEARQTQTLPAPSWMPGVQTSADNPDPMRAGDLDLEVVAEHPEHDAPSLDLEPFAEASGVEEVTKEELAAILDHFDLSALHDEDAAQSDTSKSDDAVSVQQSDSVCIGETSSAEMSLGEFDIGTIQVDVTGSGVDREILTIFIEEANEILDGMGDLVARLTTQPDDQENLRTLRRSFHTLKGSSRMAGLHAIGDAAWAIESLMNLWLEAGKPASAGLATLAERSRELFTDWIGDVAKTGRARIQLVELEALAKNSTTEIAVSIQSASSTAHSDCAPDDAARVGLTAAKPASEPAATSVNLGGVTLPAALFRIFVEEAQQNVAVVRKGLVLLGANADDGALKAFIRAAHTLGGIARAAGFSDVSLVAGVIENIPLGQIDRGKATALAYIAVDALTALVDNVAAGKMPLLPEGQCASLVREAAVLQHLSAARETVSRQQVRVIEHASLSATVEPAEHASATPVIEPLALTVDAASPATDRALHPDVEADAAPPTADPHSVPSDLRQIASASGISERRVHKDDIDEQLLPVFLDEVRDLVPLIGEDLRHLRTLPKDTTASDSLRRILHTIKGGARMVGAIRLGELVHLMEGRLELAGEEGVTQGILGILEGEFDRLTNGLDALERGISGQESFPTSPDDVNSPVTSSALPAATENRQGEETPSFAAQIRVTADALDRLVNQAGEISISRGRIEVEAQTFKQFLLELTDSVARLRAQLREIEIQAETRLQATVNQATDHEPVFDPLEFDRFTRFQELTRLMAESLHDVTTVQENLLDSLAEVQAALSGQSRLNRSLQDDLMRLRTVSFQNVGERLYRVARQAARETGKHAVFEVVGGQIEIDRGVLERIAAPLEHLVRNAVFHGIEATEFRVRAGKGETGSIRLTLRQETNDLLMLLSDDGRGIDHDRIRSKALELGWIAANAEPTRGELEQMIFRAGFSTASEVTALAGRGVGMDVVANEVRALGGRVDISTEAGRGTTFAIRVPLTTAVAKALLVSAAGRRWAILSGLVEQVQEVTGDRLTELQSSRKLVWMGHCYPLFYLPQLLGDIAAPTLDRTKHFVLLIRSGDSRVAVIVDQLAVNQDVVLKKIGPQLARLPGVSGATVLPNGEVVLILNPVPLVDGANVRNENLVEAREDRSNGAPLVMVVDDSLTVRKVTSRLLTRNEFRVATARDGLDALQQIQEIIPDVLLVDIEMPRMDGFDLTKNLKGSARTARIPIIMITSRLAPKHREYAQQLGVDVYLGKPYEERELLEYIGRFTASTASA